MDAITKALKGKKFIEGQFYYVMLVLDPDAAHEWEGELGVPARFNGYNENGDETWNFLNPEAQTWPVRWSKPLPNVNDVVVKRSDLEIAMIHISVASPEIDRLKAALEG